MKYAIKYEDTDEICRYTGKPLSRCKCKKGCEPSQVQSGEWVQPVKRGYRMECCDCGLVHIMNFRIHAGKIQFRAKREQIAGSIGIAGNAEQP